MNTDSFHSTTQDGRPRVVCVGETMLMLAPPPPELLEYCFQFTCYSGGSESNVAIGLERLGMHAGWVGKLPRNALGRKTVNEIRSFGVDTSAVVWSDQGRVGIFFVEWGASPRPLSTIYDRANSAATTMVASDLDWQYLAQAEWIHLTGITPALSEACRECTREIAARAQHLGIRVSFDMNFRSLLWDEGQAREVCRGILPYASLLVATERDMGILSQRCADREVVLRDVVAGSSLDVAVMTLGTEGSIGYDGSDYYRSLGYEVQVVNRLGAGDAFTAGLLYGYMTSGLQVGLDYGGAMAALKMTVPQNTPLIDRLDVERLLKGRHLDLVR